MFLLDTDTIILNLKGHPAVKESLRRHLNDPLMISVITCMELYYGAYKSPNIAGNLAKIQTIEGTLEVIPLGPESAQIFGMLKAQMEKKGTRLDDFDLAIAASALAHNLILVTNNISHFKRVTGLKLANWTLQPEKGVSP
jgi:predicted nucleic acid-binding protein